MNAAHAALFFRFGTAPGEELPALELLPPRDVDLVRLREQGRWFLYDYSDGVRRDRALPRTIEHARRHADD